MNCPDKETTTSASGDQQVSRAGGNLNRAQGACQAKGKRHVPHGAEASEYTARAGQTSRLQPQDNERGGERGNPGRARHVGTSGSQQQGSGFDLPRKAVRTGNEVVRPSSGGAGWASLTAVWKREMSGGREALKSPSQAQNSDGPFWQMV